MFCKHCGRKIPDDSKFCEFCGNLIGAAAEDQTPEIPDIPAPIGQPIFKEVPVQEAVEVAAPEPEPAPEPEAESEPVPEPAPEVEPTKVMPSLYPEVPPMEPMAPPPPVKKGLSRGIWITIISCAVALAAVVGVALWLWLKPEIANVNVADALTFKATGYNKDGTVTCTLDYNNIIRQAFGAEPQGDSIKKIEEYKRKSDVLKGAVSLSENKWEGKANGDEITVEIKLDKKVEEELDILFVGDTKVTYTVEGLEQSTGVDLIDEFFEVKFDGVSSEATATVELKEDVCHICKNSVGDTVALEAKSDSEGKVNFVFNEQDEEGKTVKTYGSVSAEYTLDRTDGLSNGEAVALKLKFDTEGVKKFLQYGGLAIDEEIAKNFEVKGLNTYAVSVDQVDSTAIDDWAEKYAPKLEAYIDADWAAMIHGGNSNSGTRPDYTAKKNARYVESVVLNDENGKACLFLIFAADITEITGTTGNPTTEPITEQEAATLTEEELAAADQAAQESTFTATGSETKTHYFAVKFSNIVLDKNGTVIIDEVEEPADNANCYFPAASSTDIVKQKLISIYGYEYPAEQ